MIASTQLHESLYELPRWGVETVAGDQEHTVLPDWVESREVRLLLDCGPHSGLVWLRDDVPGEGLSDEGSGQLADGSQDPDRLLSASYHRSAIHLYRAQNEFHNPFFWHTYQPLPGDDYQEQFTTTLAGLEPVLRRLEQDHDAWLLGRPGPRRFTAELFGAFRLARAHSGEPWDSAGLLSLPQDAYLQWIRVEAPGRPLHLEVSDGGDFSEPISEEMRGIFTDLGWQCPTDELRNAWMVAVSPDELERAAEIVTLTLTAAFDIDAEDLTRSRTSPGAG